MLTEKRRLLHSLFFPFLFFLLIWVIKIIEYSFDIPLGRAFGVLPRNPWGLIGIITHPLFHGNFDHLISNSFALFIISSGIFYFYRPVAFRVILFGHLFTGTLLWLIGRGDLYHIGASGLLYAYVSFLFFSGIFRRYRPLLAISLLIAFWYGSMVWGLFPTGNTNVSWEGHLSGFIAGIGLAFYYRHQKVYGEKEPTPSEAEPEKALLPPADYSVVDFSSDEYDGITYLYTEYNEE